MHKLLSFCIFTIAGLTSIFFSRTTLAANFPYEFTVEKPVEHFIVKPEFKSVTAELKVTNMSDPVYAQLQVADNPNFMITVYEVDSEQTRAINPENETFLLLPRTSKLFRVEISNVNPPQTEFKDHTVDIGVRFKIIQVPKDTKKSLTLEPVIHKYIVLGVTKDGNMSLDPKIALFQNVNGAVSILGPPQSLIVTLQNRGNHMFSTSGTITVTGPNDFEQQFVVARKYVFANDQKSLSVEGQGDLRSLIPVPSSKLATGRYTASIDLSIPGTNTPHLFGSTVFWLISPIYIIASIVVCIIIILTVFILGVKHT